MKNNLTETLKSISKFTLFAVLMFGVTACGEENRETSEPIITEEQNSEVQEEEAEWNYENTNWEEMGNNECSSNVQSPVNIDTENVIEARLADIEYEYTPFDMTIVDNGHTVQVFGTEDSFITVEDKRYQFRQFHFHSPAEHTLNDEQFPLEMHLVHQEEGTDNLVVLGVFIEEGSSNEFLDKIFSEIPSEKEVETSTNTSLNLNDYIPPAQTHYTYIGSLTTPPCTVGVDWIVFEEPIQASEEQIQRFSQLYANSARPVQDLKNRRVLKSMD